MAQKKQKEQYAAKNFMGKALEDFHAGDRVYRKNSRKAARKGNVMCSYYCFTLY